MKRKLPPKKPKDISRKLPPKKVKVKCIACGDTGKNSKGGNCHPCKVNGRI